MIALDDREIIDGLVTPIVIETRKKYVAVKETESANVQFRTVSVIRHHKQFVVVKL